MTVSPEVASIRAISSREKSLSILLARAHAGEVIHAEPFTGDFSSPRLTTAPWFGSSMSSSQESAPQPPAHIAFRRYRACLPAELHTRGPGYCAPRASARAPLLMSHEVFS